MNNHLLKKAVFFLCVTLAPLGLCRPVAAQPVEEMQVLQMFYKDKDLVVSATRHPKPISQVAENISVITAREIEEMNAHTVAEVLTRIPGLFVNSNRDFGAASLLYIQGSEQRHVLVMLDGITWNFLNEGSAETSSIPVGIIDRIEIIKGPASSAWGSSLGGVINIITKPAGTTKKPAGSVSASFGEENTQDLRAQVAGKTDSIGYYVFAGKQDSDGLEDSRDFDTYNLYSKFHIPVSESLNLSLTLGLSEPEIGLGDFPTADITSSADSRTFFTTAALEANLARELVLNISMHHFKQRAAIASNFITGLAPFIAPGELFLENIADEETTGAGAKLTWTHDRHTAVLGLDFSHGEIDQTINNGPFLQLPPPFGYSLPPTSITKPQIDTWSMYFNDTISISRWAITPGLRYDHDSITGDFISPSLGATCKLGKDTLARGSVARGFTSPPRFWSAGGGLFLDPNPSLDQEEIVSYQAGVESAGLKYLWVKGTVFRHEVDDTMVRIAGGGGPPVWNDMYMNNGEITRKGFELEAETIPFHNLSFKGGLSYVELNPANEDGSDEMSTYNLGLRYDDRNSFKAELCGRYTWWNVDSSWNANYDDFIWDFNCSKKIFLKEKTSAEIFFTTHNLFNGSQYYLGDSKNPDRWIEAGIRVKF